jgi:hypothetical protein
MDQEATFNTLATILRSHGKGLECKADQPDELHLDTRHLMENGKPLFFGAVRRGKRYVSYHLMPVYVHPQLLADISPDLRRRMQGKSCFNFTVVDQPLFEELARLTRAGRAYYRKQGYI